MTTRGLWNNNPGNVRRGSPWRGLAELPVDQGFCVFVEPVYGLRAMAVLLANYRRLHRVDTLDGVADRWAPPGDHNDTRAYAATLSHVAGYGVAEPIDLSAPNVLARVIPAIVTAENGRNPYTAVQVEDAILLARHDQEKLS